MSAAPVIPGQLYRVRIFGQEFLVNATHGCDAMAKVLQKTIPCGA